MEPRDSGCDWKDVQIYDDIPQLTFEEISQQMKYMKNSYVDKPLESTKKGREPMLLSLQSLFDFPRLHSLLQPDCDEREVRDSGLFTTKAKRRNAFFFSTNMERNFVVIKSYFEHVSSGEN